MLQNPTMADFLGPETPSNWGKWGPDDELGSLNYLDAAAALRGLREVKRGQTFTLQVQMGRTEGLGDPVWPGRQAIKRENVLDESSWDSPGAPIAAGGMHYADDKAELFLQGSTQYDALGHLWYDGKIWNGYDARSTVGAMQKASVLPIAEKGVVGRAVLVDMARFRGKKWLEPGETFDHDDLVAAARAQGTTIEKRDILVIRTGWMGYWYQSSDPESFFADLNEPGLVYSRGLSQWFQDMEIPNLVTDTMANEVSRAPEPPASLVAMPVHCSLMRNLGIAFTEIAWLDDLADACAADGDWAFLYAAAPLKISHGTGAPVNPIALR
ncbi:cyclase family protein [Streptomyces sp. NPDC051784]|uniref:cyclase family protein n=1 Tax=Streptomyces sp. NPDC051784 TaxID=3155805 RepID=UPI003437A3B1